MTTKKVIAWVTAAIIGGNGSFALWAHAHGAEPIVANSANHIQLAADTAKGFDVGVKIDRVQRTCDKIRAEIDNKRNQELQIMLSPERDNPAVIEAKHRIKNEIKDLEDLLKNEMELLHHSQNEYNALINKIRAV